MTYQGIKLRLYPNQDQQLKIKLNFGCNRFVWNQMLNITVVVIMIAISMPLPIF
ncbi:transposase [Secundilactobacillus pentosiphilus]|uniref:Transposase n=1 Tax=Secundilactobacillus pentosiphilus TaxID=1714682 RepID=A0A1Z5IQP0_9LACO|nr:helix-turn-helix domain-containing protein [Secundilactobacillus pentosiphilus]GAX03912.1 transposase [Secundilactobacillus pentosiphilus]